MAQRPKYWTFDQNFNFNLRRDHKKISYERRALESVTKRAYHRLYPEKTTKNNLVHKGLYIMSTLYLNNLFFFINYYSIWNKTDIGNHPDSWRF